MNEGSLSQEEINALFNQAATASVKPVLKVEDYLTPMEIDALGEIGNISLGSSTTALSTLLNQRVVITTPELSVFEHDHIDELVEEKQVAIHVDYTTGLRGKNLLLIKEKDAKIIANLMMGGDGTNLEPELTDLHLSAVQEAMNQMMGSAATSMSTMIHQKVDISPPEIDLVDIPLEKMKEIDDNILIKVSFRLKVGELIDSNMLQLIPISFAKEMVRKIIGGEEPKPQPEPVSPPVQTSPAPSPRVETQAPQQQVVRPEPIAQSAPPRESANVQKVEFTSFSEPARSPEGVHNLNMLYDIPLEITVELGRTELPIKKILELGPGAVIPLDKLAGEPVDILANHKLIAKGEVVVIEENFGVRITDIISPADRLSNMTK
ncbi:flagellar motor switch phosphatase FliY [Bacillus sp. DNRA2]|uniref:flagellar motor switch phosphatase FliY n=1 Tax=Bacillus sp. DNRA2 TaxID=2723053 RepID=UPI00145ECE3B|nr:flagellar motor switch phosphatase FliY [Bacillus sp. DNRA2]NMD69115.1 flagellar motor switch phosphatase FliY [Bacillus sp. DNRA2]